MSEKKTNEDLDNAYKGKLMRLFRIIMLLTKSPFGMSINELAEKLNANYRTVYRDLELLEQVGFFPEQVERGKYVIRGLDRETQKFEKNLQFSAEEAGILSRAVGNIPENHPMKKALLEKLLTFSGMEDVLKVVVKHDISRIVEKLARAAREKLQVQLRNYRSAHSASIRTRRVEPYAFSTDGLFIKGFEHDSLQNKTYKIERIEDVIVETAKWKYEKRHEKEQEADIFGITGGEHTWVKLRMSLRAASLLQEEFPLSRPHVYKISQSEYIFQGKVKGYGAIGRFILGLMDEIEVMEPRNLIDFLNKRIEEKKF